MTTDASLDWRPAWESAQALWGVQLHDPVLVVQPSPPSFAWFAFPPEITIDVAALAEAGATTELESVFAHEIGHHVLSPSTRLDSLKVRHQLSRALAASDRPLLPAAIALLSNLWSDQLINVKVATLQRRRDPGNEPGMVKLWRRLTQSGQSSGLDWVLRRAYELSWALPPGTLCSVYPPPMAVSAPYAPPVPAKAPSGKVSDKYAEQERKLEEAKAAVWRAEHAIDAGILADPTADAHLLARLVRVFADDPISGALPFGMLASAYLQRTGEVSGEPTPGCAGEAGATPPTAAEIGAILGDPRLSTVPVHPAVGADVGGGVSDSAGGQGYGLAETLALFDPSLGDAVMAAWYRNAARRWVKPLTERKPDTGGAELPGPLEQWELGDDLADLDWPGTLTASPILLPGVTTRRRSLLDDPGRPAEASLRLDLYIDSSGSMPQPERGSAAVLAGSILALSVLRGGGAVRATSWAGPGQVAGPARFLRDPVEVMASIAYSFRGGTTFPLDLLAERYRDLPPAGDAVHRHLVVLSDDGLESMFGVGNTGFEHVAATIRPTLTTATLVLLDQRRTVAPLAAAAGYDVVYLESMDDAPAVCAHLAEVLHG